MLFIFVTCFSFIFFFRYSLPQCASWVGLLSFYLWKDLSIMFPFAKLFKDTLFTILSPNPAKNHNNINTTTFLTTNNPESMAIEEMSLLDLPNLALECILEKLEPDGLCSMACVCTYFRDMCLSDHLWEGHMKKRWGRIFGSSAYDKWRLHISSIKESNHLLSSNKGRGFLMDCLFKLWHVMAVRSDSTSYEDNDDDKKMKISSQLSIDSVVSCYRALETGKFWFPAQVFNRENGHVGFMLSCYDADLSYDSRTDTFQARYPPHARRQAAIETGVDWDRIRTSLVDTSPQDLHISECLNNLRPRDHIEIQWRRNKRYPYGWWYGVVGHLEACDGNNSCCHCHESETVVLEFNQYTPASRWRQTIINRKNHHEEGNEADGFYGGIRKLNLKDEISTWQQFWPAEILE